MERQWWKFTTPIVDSTFRCVKVDLLSCVDVRTCTYMLKWYSVIFFFWWLTHLLSCTETTAQHYLWLYRCTVLKGIKIVSPSFICILKGINRTATQNIKPPPATQSVSIEVKQLVKSVFIYLFIVRLAYVHPMVLYSSFTTLQYSTTNLKRALFSNHW